MAYQNGTFQYFDNQFLYNNNDYRKPEIMIYPEDTFLGYIQKEHPLWFILLQKSGRNFNTMKTYTMFIPMDLTADDVISMDKNTALEMMNYHTIEGIYPLFVLETSNSQQLNTLISGKMMYLSIYDGDIIFNNRSRLIGHGPRKDNVLIYTISNHLIR